MIVQSVKRALTSVTYFSILYFTLLSIDIGLRLAYGETVLRYISKPMFLLSLMVFYVINNKCTSKRSFLYMIIALICFLIGDLLLVTLGSTLLFVMGMFFFIVGKIFYAIRFSNQRDFKLGRLLPFLSICFLYTLLILNLIYEKLESLFFPVIVYFFVGVMVLQFAFLRKNDVNNQSYLLVFIGIIMSIMSESLIALDMFYYPGFAFSEFTIMLTYGIAQYLIVLGIVKEVKEEDKLSIIKSAI